MAHFTAVVCLMKLQTLLKKLAKGFNFPETHQHHLELSIGFKKASCFSDSGESRTTIIGVPESRDSKSGRCNTPKKYLQNAVLHNSYCCHFAFYFLLFATNINFQQQMTGKAKRVAVALELNYGHKRHVETYAGCLKYAKEAGWDTVITPTSDRIFNPKRMKNLSTVCLHELL